MKTLDPVLHKIREEAILQRARHLFATKGFTETSMDDIAHASHMQKASLYHYFKSKQQILQQMVDMEGEHWTERLKDYDAGTNLRDTLARIGHTFLKDMDDPRRRGRDVGDDLARPERLDLLGDLLADFHQARFLCFGQIDYFAPHR